MATLTWPTCWSLVRRAWLLRAAQFVATEPMFDIHPRCVAQERPGTQAWQGGVSGVASVARSPQGPTNPLHGQQFPMALPFSGKPLYLTPARIHHLFVDHFPQCD